MKSIIINAIAVLFLFIVTILDSCNKDNETITNTGKVVFDTNIQSMLNCGPFNVDVYIEGVYAGSISEPSGKIDKMPECINTSSTLMIQKTIGSYCFYAEAKCGDYGYWSDTFEIRPGKCTHVFLGINNCYLKNN